MLYDINLNTRYLLLIFQGKNTSEIRQINQKLSQMEASAGRLETITRDLNRAEQELSSTESTIDLDSIKQDISQMDKQRRELDSKLSNLNTELNKLTLESKSRTELDMLKKDKVSKEDQIRRLKSKHEDTIVYLLNEMPTSNLRGRLETYIGEQTDNVKQCSSELQKANQTITSKEAEKKMIQHQLKQKEEELRTLDEKIFNVCGSQNYDDEYQNIQQKLTTAQESRGSLLGAEHFFKKYVSDLEKDSPCCPLCHRDFDNEQDVRELILELQNKLRMVPGKIQKSEKDLEEYQKKYDNMTQLKPLKENVSLYVYCTVPKNYS
ncbi:hypothetical protein LOTGIDRAFT_139012 [Lottia gigantea]|uniref:Zinc-hook domain-containing protein n=1 Tax=Lottia gigantea TaxID=225164 RepID=V4B6W2_LOTGI|nr:hypothetical protein LOTGIDRAFT_139012 [Lottia gigantea]ESP01817.1 hypothetical protein LOTGIDRAFT_139012 [Lottia gigantea]